MIPHKTALITAACSEIGVKVARQLDRQGYHLLLLDENKIRVEALAEDLCSAIAVVSDFNKADDLLSFCELIALQSPPLNLAFINSVITYPSTIEDLRHTRINQMLEDNFWVAIQLIKACATNMQRQKSGHIIACTSLQGSLSAYGSHTYLTSKIGLRGFLAGIKTELRNQGVRVSGLYPGASHKPIPKKEWFISDAINAMYQTTQVKDVSKAFFSALDTGKLESYISCSDTLCERSLNIFRKMLTALYLYFDKHYGKPRNL